MQLQEDLGAAKDQLSYLTLKILSFISNNQRSCLQLHTILWYKETIRKLPKKVYTIYQLQLRQRLETGSFTDLLLISTRIIFFTYLKLQNTVNNTER